jgi:hypothetical protein
MNQATCISRQASGERRRDQGARKGRRTWRGRISASITAALLPMESNLASMLPVVTALRSIASCSALTMSSSGRGSPIPPLQPPREASRSFWNDGARSGEGRLVLRKRWCGDQWRRARRRRSEKRSATTAGDPDVDPRPGIPYGLGPCAFSWVHEPTLKKHHGIILFRKTKTQHYYYFKKTRAIRRHRHPAILCGRRRIEASPFYSQLLQHLSSYSLGASSSSLAHGCFIHHLYSAELSALHTHTHKRCRNLVPTSTFAGCGLSSARRALWLLALLASAVVVVSLQGGIRPAGHERARRCAIRTAGATVPRARRRRGRGRTRAAGIPAATTTSSPPAGAAAAPGRAASRWCWSWLLPLVFMSE